MPDTGDNVVRKASSSTTPALPPATVVSALIENIGAGPHAKKAVVLQFSEAMNLGDAQNPAAYRLVTVPNTKLHPGRPLVLAQAKYNSANFTVILFTSKPLVLKTAIQLTVFAASLRDALGRPLNGGANFVSILK